MLKVVLAYEGSVLHSLLIDHIASNCKLTDNIGSPLSELSCSQHIYAYKSEFIGAICFVILLAHRYRKQYNKHDIVHRCDEDSRICGTPVNIHLNYEEVHHFHFTRLGIVCRILLNADINRNSDEPVIDRFRGRHSDYRNLFRICAYTSVEKVHKCYRGVVNIHQIAVFSGHLGHF